MKVRYELKCSMTVSPVNETTSRVGSIQFMLIDPEIVERGPRENGSLDTSVYFDTTGPNKLYSEEGLKTCAQIAVQGLGGIIKAVEFQLGKAAADSLLEYSVKELIRTLKADVSQGEGKWGEEGIDDTTTLASKHTKYVPLSMLQPVVGQSVSIKVKSGREIHDVTWSDKSYGLYEFSTTSWKPTI